jgi:hypothetical protein
MGIHATALGSCPVTAFSISSVQLSSFASLAVVAGESLDLNTEATNTDLGACIRMNFIKLQEC